MGSFTCFWIILLLSWESIAASESVEISQSEESQNTNSNHQLSGSDDELLLDNVNLENSHVSEPSASDKEFLSLGTHEHAENEQKVVEDSDSTNPPFPSQSSSFWEPEVDEPESGRDYAEIPPTQDIISEKDKKESPGTETTSTGNQSAAERPNIILIITDDQDVELGSMEYMPETLKVFRAGGIEFRHGYVSTPICCPSRSSLLTGLYVHNHEVFTNNDNCSSINWREKYEKTTFASHLWSAGYYTSYIGKYLNKYDGSHIPYGWDEWNGLLMNSRYYNYTLNRNGKRYRYGSDLERDYYPDSIARDGIDFLDRVAGDPSKRPFLLVMSFPSPHGPEDSAPKYSNLFLNATPHHTPSYNYAPNVDKQWILRVTDKMTPTLKDFTNLLMTKRLQTLQSVDLAVRDIFQKLEDDMLRDSTYTFYTSDHGYHVGQFGLVKGKSMPYEFDIRVPFFLAGPKAMVVPGTVIREPVLNIDFAPTFLDLAGISIPETMDGRSMLPLLKKYCPTCQNNEPLKWPDVFLIESPGRRSPPNSGPGSGESVKHSKKMHKRKSWEKIVFDDDEVLSLTNLCTMHPHPCAPGQKKYCRKEKNRIRFRKCRQNIDFLVSTRHFSSNPRINDPAFGHNLSLSEMSGQKCSCRFRRSADLDLLDEDIIIDWESERKKIDDEIEKLKQRIDYLRQRRREMRKKWLTDNYPKTSTIGHRHKEYKKKGRGKASDTRIMIDEGMDEHEGAREEDYEDSNESEETEREDKDENGSLEDEHNEDDGGLVSRDGLFEENSTTETSLTGSNITSPIDTDDGSIEENIEQPELSTPILATSTTRKPGGHRGKNKHNRNKMKGVYLFNKNTTPVTENDGSCNCYNDPRWLRQKEKEDRKHRKLLSKLRKQQRLFKRIEDPQERQQAEVCGKEEKMNCFWHDSEHWRTAPFWTSGSFCFCMNANNNSYSCLRSVNETHNYLYCQFVTGFKMYFDLMQDPHQLKNVIATLPATNEDWILARLYKLKQCKGKEECWSDNVGNDDSVHPSLWEQIFGRWPKKRRRGGRRRKYQNQET